MEKKKIRGWKKRMSDMNETLYTWILTFFITSVLVTALYAIFNDSIILSILFLCVIIIYTCIMVWFAILVAMFIYLVLEDFRHISENLIIKIATNLLTVILVILGTIVFIIISCIFFSVLITIGEFIASLIIK